MKILLDMQCCQTEARNRGIGRYSLSLAKELIRIGGDRHDFNFLLNARYLKQSGSLLDEIGDLGGSQKIVLFDYPDVNVARTEREPLEQVGNALRENRIAALQPDVYHISSLFEGESVFGAALAFTSMPAGSLVTSATLYDFIPSLYREQYLANWEYAAWYKRTLGVARQIDIGLAISDVTKSDAERLLGLRQNQVVNILGSVDDEFKVLPSNAIREGQIWQTIGATQPFILYVAGPDHRKNLERTLEAFALLGEKAREVYKLVIVFSAEESMVKELRARAIRLGIESQLVIPGYVSEKDLLQLYNYCDLFIFPSLYEGLGLPVMEAMRCGAPVLVGDNSSLVEIVDEPAFRFDATSASKMAVAIQRVLGDKMALTRMRAYSKRRSAFFSWSESAHRTLEAWERRHDERKDCPTSLRVSSPRWPRIAMFTPLPPARSGIADYAAELLPAIGKYASLEVFVDDPSEVTFRAEGISLWHASQFPRKADSFDVIVYQIGNSPFHHYMLPFLEAYPGVMVLHDVFLGHLTHDPGNPAPFYCQVIAEHGGGARAILQEKGLGREAALELIDRFSNSAAVVRKSLGAIVHSRFARDIVIADEPSAVRPKLVVMPQFRASVPTASRPDVATARRLLNIPKHVTLIISVGHVASTKGVLELVEGFVTSKTGASGSALLVLVGELEGGPTHATAFSREMQQALEAHAGVQITGFVGKRDYDLYLAAADIGVQLRTITRGETSRAILDMVANGLPFIFSRLGAAAELPPGIGHPLDTCEPQAIASAIDALATDRSGRDAMSKAELAFAAEVMDPDKLARRFVDAVLDMKAHHDTFGAKAMPSTIARLLRNATLKKEMVRDISKAYVRQHRYELPPRLLMDVTHIRAGDLETGVQRVVRELTRSAYTWADANLRAQAFAFTDTGLVYADDYAQRCGARAAIEAAAIASGPLDLRPFDKILLVDGSWHLTDWMHQPLEDLDALGGAAFGVVHDILPIQHPELFLEHVTDSFSKWLSLVTRKGAGLICSSRGGADSLIHHIRDSGMSIRPGLRVGYARLGANFEPKGRAPERDLDANTRRIAERGNLFLMVGSIEPRKGHAYVLDAFERLWAADEDVTLVFAGKVGWNVDLLMKRFADHPEKGRRFFYLGFTPEPELVHLYKTAAATIVASIAEGFGLPILEAAHHGSPLLLSDIAVFKEIGGWHARYFAAGSASALVEAVKRHLTDGPIPSNGVATPSWQQCAEGVFGFVNGNDTYHVF